MLGRPAQEMSPLVQLFKLPSLTVNAIQASSRKQAGNIINDAAWAKVTIRLVPDLNPEKVLEQLKAHLLKHAPWGVEVSFKSKPATALGRPILRGPLSKRPRSRLKKVTEFAPYKIGSGGSIPFVTPFAEALGGAPRF